MNQTRIQPQLQVRIRRSHLAYPQYIPSPSMHQFVEQLVEQHGYHLEQPTLNLCFVHQIRPEKLLVSMLMSSRIMIARMIQMDNHWWENPLVIFEVNPAGWFVDEVQYFPSMWEPYQEYVGAHDKFVLFDAYGQPILATIVEYVVHIFRSADWLGQAKVGDTLQSRIVVAMPERDLATTSSTSKGGIWD